MRAHVGDTLIVEGDPPRTGLIIGVPHVDGTPPYIVKWLADGHIAMMSPGDYARVVPAPLVADQRDLGPASAQVPATIVELTGRDDPVPILGT